MKKSFICVCAALLLLIAAQSFGATVRDKMTFKGAVNFTGSTTVGSADVLTTSNTKTLTNKTLTSPTVTQPKMTYGFTSYAYTSASGATYSVADTVASPTAYKITGGSGTTTFTMTYTGTAAGNAGKMFYIINSSSNTITFKQSGATGVNVATLKIITVIGNGTDFERITADQ